jgi:hypothetical protein
VRTRTFCELFCENWIWLVSKNLIPAQHWLWPNHSTYYNNNLLTRDIPMYNKTEEEIRRMFQLRIHKFHLPSGKHFENSNIESDSWAQKISHSTTQCGTPEVSWKIDCYIPTKLTWNILPLSSLLISTSSSIIYNMVCCYLKSYGLNFVCLICKGSPQPSHISGILNELKNQCHMRHRLLSINSHEKVASSRSKLAVPW